MTGPNVNSEFFPETLNAKVEENQRKGKKKTAKNRLLFAGWFIMCRGFKVHDLMSREFMLLFPKGVRAEFCSPEEVSEF